jgi:BirA family biotin operon repressor/biotin-[acetyl-CoA-carboxylase] ligase
MKLEKKIHWVKSCSSTNDLAKKLIRSGEAEGTFVVAEEQTSGRGTKGRHWFSAKRKGLYLSIILYPSHSHISLLPLVAGLAVKDAIFEALSIEIKLKWPNDILWHKKKLGGILCESGFMGDQVHYVILGIGLNVKHRRDDFPVNLRRHATSLKLVTGADIDITVIIEAMKRAFDDWYTQFLENKRNKIVHAFQKSSVFPIGKEIIVLTGKEKISGNYNGITSRGELRLEVKGKKRLFYSAEIMAVESNKEEG